MPATNTKDTRKRMATNSELKANRKTSSTRLGQTPTDSKTPAPVDSTTSAAPPRLAAHAFRSKILLPNRWATSRIRIVCPIAHASSSPIRIPRGAPRTGARRRRFGIHIGCGAGSRARKRSSPPSSAAARSAGLRRLLEGARPASYASKPSTDSKPSDSPKKFIGGRGISFETYVA